MTRKLQMLLVALICTILLAPLAAAQEEPREKPSKERKPALTDQMSLKRSCDSPGKSTFTQRFGKRPTPDFLKAEAGGCYGWCNCNLCECWYYDSDLGCCFDGCDWCWGELDGGGFCGEQ